MKKIALMILVMIFPISLCFAQESDQVDSLLTEINKLSNAQKATSSMVETLKTENKKLSQQVDHFLSKEHEYRNEIDSLMNEITELTIVQGEDRNTFKKDIDEAKAAMSTGFERLDGRTLWGGLALIVIIIACSLYLYLRSKKNATSMSEVRKAQEILQATQTKLQEDSLKLDNHMLTLIEQKMSTASQEVSAELDHSLTLKVADELVRIELNLSRMDSSIRGYKQLSKAVERIKNNFLANGYEIVDMLGKPYNEGMKLVANFVPDETLKEGEQIITAITKPQINYNGKMIQSAQVTVSQNI